MRGTALGNASITLIGASSQRGHGRLGCIGCIPDERRGNPWSRWQVMGDTTGCELSPVNINSIEGGRASGRDHIDGMELSMRWNGPSATHVIRIDMVDINSVCLRLTDG